jgi:rod shape-determining protein MreC
MLRLLEFLYRQRIFGLFILLEVVSFWLIFSYSHRYNTQLLNTSNRVTGNINARVSTVIDYFSLVRVNQELSHENARLRQLLSSRTLQTVDSTFAARLDSGYQVIPARTVASTFLRPQNYLTLQIDPADSVVTDMGVVSADGIVGRIKSTSPRYATVTSLLHPNLLVSAKVKSTKALCTVQWDGANAMEADLKYVARHLKLTVGDTVVTSGHDAIFPEGWMIGVVTKVELPQKEAFYVARVKLGHDFTKSSPVYIIRIPHLEERKNLESTLQK